MSEDSLRSRRHATQSAACQGQPANPQASRGERGPNCPPHVRERVGRELAQLAEDRGGNLEPDDYKPYRVQTGRKLRQLQRYREDAEKLIAKERLLADGGDDGPTVAEVAEARARLRGERYLPRVGEREELVLTAAPSEYEAYLALRVDKKSIVCQRNMSPSSFYEMLGRLPRATRFGYRKGSDEMHLLEPHLPRRITRLGQSNSVDVKHLRVWVRASSSDRRSFDVWSVRWEDEACNLVRSKQLFDHQPADEEIAALYAIAVRGWSCHVPGRGELIVEGAPSTIRSDNGSNLSGPKMRSAVSLTGTVQSSSQSGESEGNGRHERGNLPFDITLRRVPGYSKPRTARLSKPYAEFETDDLLDFSQLSAIFHRECDDKNALSHPMTKRHEGRTPLEMAYDLQQAGESELEPVDDEKLFGLAQYLGIRKFDKNAGTVRLDNQYFHHPDLAARGEDEYALYGLPGDASFVFVATAGSKHKYIATAVDVDEIPGFIAVQTKVEAVEREKHVDRLQKEVERRFNEGSWATRLYSTFDDVEFVDGIAFDAGSAREPDGPTGVAAAARRHDTPAERAGARHAKGKRDNAEHDPLLDDLDPLDEGHSVKPAPVRPAPKSKRKGGPTGRSAGLKPEPETGPAASTSDRTDPDDDGGLSGFMARQGL